MAMAEAKDRAKAPTDGTELMLHYHRTKEHEAEVKAFLARGYRDTPFIVNTEPPDATGYTVAVAHAYRLKGGRIACERIDLAARAAALRGMAVEDYRLLAKKAADKLRGEAADRDADAGPDEEADL
jgi:hypothetical protein